MTQREEFEAWYVKTYPFASTMPGKFEREGGDYTDTTVNVAWQAFQFAQAAQPAHAHAIDKSPERVEKRAGNVQVPVWIAVSERMPPNGTPVLADTGHKFPLRACWVGKFSEEVTCDFNGDADYNEQEDLYYWPEGWYEWNRYDETHWWVDAPVLHWMPLPAAPSTKEDV